MFAALFLLACLGIAIFFALSWAEHLLLRRWQARSGTSNLQCHPVVRNKIQFLTV
jgi:hypothetical protein